VEKLQDRAIAGSIHRCSTNVKQPFWRRKTKRAAGVKTSGEKSEEEPARQGAYHGGKKADVEGPTEGGPKKKKDPNRLCRRFYGSRQDPLEDCKRDTWLTVVKSTFLCKPGGGESGRRTGNGAM